MKSGRLRPHFKAVGFAAHFYFVHSAAVRIKAVHLIVIAPTQLPNVPTLPQRSQALFLQRDLQQEARLQSNSIYIGQIF